MEEVKRTFLNVLNVEFDGTKYHVAAVSIEPLGIKKIFRVEAFKKPEGASRYTFCSKEEASLVTKMFPEKRYTRDNVIFHEELSTFLDVKSTLLEGLLKRDACKDVARAMSEKYGQEVQP